MKTIFIITRSFPLEERYCLVDQLKRASISICLNLAKRSSGAFSKDQSHFTNLSQNSLMEVLYELYISINLSYIYNGVFSEVKKKVSEISIQLNSLCNSQLNK